MSIQSNFEALLRDVEQRGGGKVKLLPVTKMVGVPEIQILYDLGCREFGENRIEVLAPKVEAMPKDIIWHFIGHLQSNKVRKVVKAAPVIHSVDSLELAERIDRIAGEEGKCPRIFLEISVSGEECKGGFPVAKAAEIAEAALRCTNMKTVGLMTMAPLDAPVSVQHQVFAGLRECREKLEKLFPGCVLPELSMGMSDDYPEAIACGSTLVRIGSAIFRE